MLSSILHIKERLDCWATILLLCFIWFRESRFRFCHLIVPSAIFLASLLQCFTQFFSNGDMNLQACLIGAMILFLTLWLSFSIFLPLNFVPWILRRSGKRAVNYDAADWEREILSVSQFLERPFTRTDAQVTNLLLRISELQPSIATLQKEVLSLLLVN